MGKSAERATKESAARSHASPFFKSGESRAAFFQPKLAINTPARAPADVPQVQRNGFTPWPGQTGSDVAGTRTTAGDEISEQVQRIGDPTYAALGPALLTFNTRTCALTVSKQIQFVRAGTGAAQLAVAEFDALKARILRVAREQLNGWVTIRVGADSGCSMACAGRVISVRVVTTEGSGSAASTVNLYPTWGREDAGNIGANANDRTLWHELGHIVLGAADEYYEERRPDGTPRPAERVNTSDWSIMSGEANARRAMMHARHFSHLTAWLSRRFPDCTFTMNEASRPIVVEFSPALTLGGFVTTTGRAGLYYSLGMNFGIPLTRLRELELTLGPRLNFIYAPGDVAQLIMGIRAGLERQFGSSGFRLGAFGEGGGVGFTDLGRGRLGASPYGEGGVGLGYTWGGTAGLGLEGAAGAREFAVPRAGGLTTEISPYFRLGLSFSLDL